MPQIAERRRPLVLLALTASLLAAGAHRASAQPAAPAPVPDFKLTTLDGKTITRDSLKGKVVLIDFWASWCGPCVRAVPELKDLSQKMAGQPFVLVGVSVDEQKEQITGFLDKFDIGWPQVWDGKMEFTYGMFQVKDFPTYVLLDHRGHVIYRRSGWTLASKIRLEDTIKTAVEDARKAATPATPATKTSR